MKEFKIWEDKKIIKEGLTITTGNKGLALKVASKIFSSKNENFEGILNLVEKGKDETKPEKYSCILEKVNEK